MLKASKAIEGTVNNKNFCKNLEVVSFMNSSHWIDFIKLRTNFVPTSVHKINQIYAAHLILPLTP